MRSKRVQTLQRRFITLPGFFFMFVVCWLLFPLWLLVAFALDMVKKKRWVYVRFTLTLMVYLGCEVVGMVMALILWPIKVNQRWFIRSHFGLQRWWLGTLYRAIHRLYGLSLTVTGQEVLEKGGAFLAFGRHISYLDTFLPVRIISQPYGIFLKYVVKQELHWSPSFDLVGHRLPNHFVQRITMASRREIQNIANLAKQLGDAEGVFIYPEGTRFSAQKRKRLLNIMKKRESALFCRAKGFDHLMPPQLGGAFALLNANPETDVLFMVHTGFEGIRDIKDLLSGDLIGRHVQVHLWRVPRAEIPEDESSQTTWMYDQWEHMNQWVDAHLPTQ